MGTASKDAWVSGPDGGVGTADVPIASGPETAARLHIFRISEAIDMRLSMRAVVVTVICALLVPLIAAA